MAIALDRRLKLLRFLIKSEVEIEKSLKTSRIFVRVSKRVYLVELTARYMEENEAKKAVPKKRRDRELPRLSPMDRFTDLLFPETIKFKSKQASKKRKQVSKKKGKQVSQKGCPREAAKRTLEYWIRLGEPLVRMVQRFGHGIMLLLPENLTDKN